MDARAKTARSAGAVGAGAVVPRVVLALGREGLGMFGPHGRTLDFGCGKDQLHVKLFRAEGWKIEGTDLSLPKKPQGTFDVVYASNVLNVQETEQELNDTFAQVAAYMHAGSQFVCNWPSSPRKLPYSVRGFESVLRSKFGQVWRVPYSYSKTPVWVCSNPFEYRSRYAK